MPTHVYLIRALTNLHPGSGEANYGVIDKQIQRDPTTKYPTIHMSGIKGALREFFREQARTNQITDVFGSDRQAGDDTIRRGKVRFISADLLALPEPVSGGQGPYRMVYNADHLAQWQAKAELFEAGAGARVQSGDLSSNGGNVAGLSVSEFTSLATQMPVVARNYLDDGQSKNLWYEEFVPREAVFATLLQGEETYLDHIQSAINGQVVQLGGNATVGYGYCLFTLKA